MSHTNSKRKARNENEKRRKKTHLFAHVQLELLHGLVQLQTTHELVRLERHVCVYARREKMTTFYNG